MIINFTLVVSEGEAEVPASLRQPEQEVLPVLGLVPIHSAQGLNDLGVEADGAEGPSPG